MSYVRIWVHSVWGTKNRFPFIIHSNKQEILNHIKENARIKGIYIDSINGDREHIHCLISLKAEQSISKVLQLVKGESSFWINKNEIAKHKFEWADEYYAVSISESQLSKVRDYIKNQEEHHKVKTWKVECDEFIEKYGFQKILG